MRALLLAFLLLAVPLASFAPAALACPMRECPPPCEFCPLEEVGACVRALASCLVFPLACAVDEVRCMGILACVFPQAIAEPCVVALG